MRAATHLRLSSLFSLVAVLTACGSDPAAPEIDPGKDNQDGGTTMDGGGGSNGDSQAAAYPPGPYGYAMDQVIHDFQFNGLKNPKAVDYKADNTTLKPISMHDFYNPTKDPARPRVLLLTWSARWCSVCQVQAGGSPADGQPSAMEEYTNWKPKGVEFMEAIFEDLNYEPSQATDLAAWVKAYKFEFPAVLDSNLQSSGVTFNKSAAPYNMVIDLSTMKVTYAEAGLFQPSIADSEFNAVLGL